MALFKRKKSSPVMDVPEAMDQLRREVDVAIAKAQARHCGDAAILTTLKEAIASHEYCSIVNAPSSFGYARTIEKIG